MMTIVKPDTGASGNNYLPSPEIVEQALAYCREMFRDLNPALTTSFRQFTPERINQIGCQPNSLFQADKDIGRIRVLVSYRPESEGRVHWGLNRAGVDYVSAAQQAGRITGGVVVLTANFLAVTKADWIVPVMDAFRNAPLRHSPRYDYGPFHWSDANIRPAPSRGPASGYIDDPDTPF